MDTFFVCVDTIRSQMVANGESMDRKWRKETRVLGLITDAPWQLVAQFGSKYVFV